MNVVQQNYSSCERIMNKPDPKKSRVGCKTMAPVVVGNRATLRTLSKSQAVTQKPVSIYHIFDHIFFTKNSYLQEFDHSQKHSNEARFIPKKETYYLYYYQLNFHFYTPHSLSILVYQK